MEVNCSKAFFLQTILNAHDYCCSLGMRLVEFYDFDEFNNVSSISGKILIFIEGRKGGAGMNT